MQRREFLKDELLTTTGILFISSLLKAEADAKGLLKWERIVEPWTCVLVQQM